MTSWSTQLTATAAGVPTWVRNTTCILLFISLTVLLTSQLPPEYFPFTTTAKARRGDGQMKSLLLDDSHASSASGNMIAMSSELTVSDAESHEGLLHSRGNSIRKVVEDLANFGSPLLELDQDWRSVVVNVTLQPVIQGYHHHRLNNHYATTTPPPQHTFQRRREDEHHHHQQQQQMYLTVELEVLGRLLVLDLHPTRRLLTSTYSRQTGEYDDDDEEKEEDERRTCEYQGEVRGQAGSWAALSICSGLRGVVVVGGQQLLVSPLPGSSSLLQPHRIISAHLVPLPGHCGVTSSGLGPTVNHTQPHTYPPVVRRKRQRGVPLWVTDTTRYVELVLVVDRHFYRRYGERSHSRCRAIVNIVNAIYRPLDVVVMLSGLEVWKKKNEMKVFSNSYKTLENLKKYRRELRGKRSDWNNDNTILLSGLDFDGKNIGLALVAGMCEERLSVGVVQDIGEAVGLVAMVVAHELGHSLGFEHDGDVKGCRCPTHTCVMAGFRSSTFRPDIGWSSCSVKKMNTQMYYDAYQCLKNVPTTRDSNCGDGVVDVEKDEECDCGPPEFCSNPCCDAKTCRLAPHATCAFGSCCNNETCQMKPLGEVCRGASNDCDLEEFCSGTWHLCPSDVTKADGEHCSNHTGHCYKGVCGSHDGRCRELWGAEAGAAAPTCYQLNTRRLSYANCGILSSTSLRPCSLSDVRCGTLHCEVASDNSLPNIAVYQYGSTERDGHQCHFIFADRRKPASDWLTPEGASCGDDKMCVRQHCVDVPPPLGDCTTGCSGRGVCNSLGHCHCNPGFGHPDCSTPGLGGSLDSGPMGETPQRLSTTTDDISIEDVTPTAAP